MERLTEGLCARGLPTLYLCPLLQESLHELNRRMPTPLPMNRFRPNIVISGGAAFAEDTWGELVIGRLDMQMRKPCGRCKVHPSLQPAMRLMQVVFNFAGHSSRTHQPGTLLARALTCSRSDFAGHSARIWSPKPAPCHVGRCATT